MPTEEQAAKVILIRSVQEIDKNRFSSEVLTDWINRAKEGVDQDKGSNLRLSVNVHQSETDLAI